MFDSRVFLVGEAEADGAFCHHDRYTDALKLDQGSVVYAFFSYGSRISA